MEEVTKYLHSSINIDLNKIFKITSLNFKS
jgi:hypothetical protein